MPYNDYAPHPFLKNRGGFRKLKVYHVTQILYDLTYYFTQRYIAGAKKDRTEDQMIQAARSAKQNIAEGSDFGTTTTELEIKLTNTARSSLTELCLDYEDYLRVRGLTQWTLGHPRFEHMRRYTTSEQFNSEYASLFQKLNDEELANLAITLCKQAHYMLYRLLEAQQKAFVAEGGIKEKMSQARKKHRGW